MPTDLPCFELLMCYTITPQHQRIAILSCIETSCLLLGWQRRRKCLEAHWGAREREGWGEKNYARSICWCKRVITLLRRQTKTLGSKIIIKLWLFILFGCSILSKPSSDFGFGSRKCEAGTSPSRLFSFFVPVPAYSLQESYYLLEIGLHLDPGFVRHIWDLL